MAGSLINPSLQLTCMPEIVESKAILSFLLPEKAEVTLKILNNAGDAVRVLLNEKLNSGDYHITFDAGNLPAGNYTGTMLIGTSKEVIVCNTPFQIHKQ